MIPSTWESTSGWTALGCCDVKQREAVIAAFLNELDEY